MIDKFKEKSLANIKKLKQEVRVKTIGYITAAFGLVAGLAWNDAIKTAIELIFPAAGNTVIVKFIYAFVFTIVLVLITVQINKILGEK